MPYLLFFHVAESQSAGAGTQAATDLLIQDKTNEKK